MRQARVINVAFPVPGNVRSMHAHELRSLSPLLHRSMRRCPPALSQSVQAACGVIGVRSTLGPLTQYVRHLGSVCAGSAN